MTEMDTKGLDKLIRILGKRTPKVRVGILGATNAREGDNSNAEIGAKHEFGWEGMPIRSFIRMPLSERLFEELKTSGVFTEETMDEVIESRLLVPWLEEIGIAAEGVISDAFNTRGFGQWEKSNMRFKKNKQTLVETQQLRNSITHVVIT